MDTLDNDRHVIETILTDYSKIKYAYGDLQNIKVFDRERDHYLLVTTGWDQRRIHGCLVHVDIVDGKFWIQRDGTEYGIARYLEDAGIPKHRIVPAFRPPEIRAEAGYAVA